MTERLAAINCTSCGGSLEVRGGHRVRSLTCGYCGSVMDAHEDFRVIAEYKDLVRPDTPIEIGMKGVIKGVEFTVIGTIGYEMYEEGVTYSWVSHQLYSPTHGYCWLTWNEGHFIFSRRVRILPDPPMAWRKEPKQRIRVGKQRFRVFETFTAFIDFVEGELTWVARRGDKVSVVEAIDPPYAFEYERSGDEIEYSMSEYLPRALVVESFGLDISPRTPGHVHPAQPFIAGPFAEGIQRNGFRFLVVAAAALVFTYIFGAGSTVTYGELEAESAQPKSYTFDVTRPTHLMRLELNAPVDNNWTYLEVEITDNETDEPVVALGREIGFYAGYEGGEYWSEGSRDASAQFKLPSAGSYTMEIAFDPQSAVKPTVRFRLNEGVWPIRYMLGLFVIAALATASIFIRRFLFERRRWADIESDDD